MPDVKGQLIVSPGQDTRQGIMVNINEYTSQAINSLIGKFLCELSIQVFIDPAAPASLPSPTGLPTGR